MKNFSRRGFLKASGAAAGAGLISSLSVRQSSGENKRDESSKVEILNPQGRVPLSFVIDDSTCLVNMGHFCTPQFAQAWPERPVYKKPWKTWPREIPDTFVREFGEWCAEHGVKGKYSIVPYPACVGWLDRELPGWPRNELLQSLKLVRDLMLPNWDIHPEMITHTRVIDLKTGRPREEISAATMENSYPREKKSVDEMAAYLAYALRILKNCDLPCQGITTPGGFGNLVKSELSLAVQQSVRDVFGVELPHYFKYVIGGKESTQPKLEQISGRDTDDPLVTVNVPAGTGDWFGGWQGDREPEGPRYSSDDATSGRMIELIERGEPAIMLCHWPGMYCNGTKRGFEAFKKVVLAIDRRFGNQTTWMKMSEIARYWAAKEFTKLEQTDGSLNLHAAFACPKFTFRFSAPEAKTITFAANGKKAPLKRIDRSFDLTTGTWTRNDGKTIVCLDLPKGRTALSF